MIDIAIGMMPEVAFQIDAKTNFNCEIELDREFYGGPMQTDEGWDVRQIKKDTGWRRPRQKIQIKDVQYFLLVPRDEFYGRRAAELFVAYCTHWNKAYTAQQFLRALGGRGDEVFNDFPALDGIRVARRGWATTEDFRHLPPRESYRNLRFNADNMFVYYEDLRAFSTFPFDLL
jgi:hypothetical protein